MLAIAISFFVMILAVSISSGFRNEIRKGIAEISGDIFISMPSADYSGDEAAIDSVGRYLAMLTETDGVKRAVPAVYRAGIVRVGDMIDGAFFKGIPGGGDSLKVSVPRSLAERLSLGIGDPLPAYFIGNRVKVRKFTIDNIYEDALGDSGGYVVFAGIGDMRRLNSWGEDKASAVEVILDRTCRGNAQMKDKAEEIAMRLLSVTPEDEDVPSVTSAPARYPAIFSWLDLIDRNVLVILVLMTVVAGFNMVSALLILIFRNTSTIGILKSMGMGDFSVAEIFLRTSSRMVLKGMLAGNAAALFLCMIQAATHVVRLNPHNYFVSFVPVHVSLPLVAVADVVAYLLIMAVLLIPSLAVSRVDPAATVRAK